MGVVLMRMWILVRYDTYPYDTDVVTSYVTAC